jgi:hypothetical protein
MIIRREPISAERVADMFSGSDGFSEAPDEYLQACKRLAELLSKVDPFTMPAGNVFLTDRGQLKSRRPVIVLTVLTLLLAVAGAVIVTSEVNNPVYIMPAWVVAVAWLCVIATALDSALAIHRRVASIWLAPGAVFLVIWGLSLLGYLSPVLLLIVLLTVSRSRSLRAQAQDPTFVHREWPFVSVALCLLVFPLLAWGFRSFSWLTLGIGVFFVGNLALMAWVRRRSVLEDGANIANMGMGLLLGIGLLSLLTLVLGGQPVVSCNSDGFDTGVPIWALSDNGVHGEGEGGVGLVGPIRISGSQQVGSATYTFTCENGNLIQFGKK